MRFANIAFEIVNIFRHTAKFKILVILAILNFHPYIIDRAWFWSIVTHYVECQTCYQVARDRGTFLCA